jgi:hypothetical protein
MQLRKRAAAPNLLWTVYQSDRELSHLSLYFLNRPAGWPRMRLRPGLGWLHAGSSPLFEIARVLVRFDHGASFIVNANQSVM